MQEIAGAKPVRDANVHAPKAFSAMPSLGKRVSPVQFRVGAPVFGGHAQASQSNQRSGRRHKPAGPGAAPGTARHLHAGHDEDFASMQQAADFFCKEIPPEQSRSWTPSSEGLITTRMYSGALEQQRRIHPLLRRRLIFPEPTFQTSLPEPACLLEANR